MVGTGGMAVGLEQGGLDVVGILELNDHYGAPQRMNWPEKVHATDVEQWDPMIEKFMEEGVDVVFSNPPCQGLTGASRTSGPDNPKNQLFVEGLKWALKMQPKFVVQENIPRMLTMGYKYVEETIRIADSHGYSTVIHRHRAGDFGVCQDRPRVMFVYQKEDAWWPSHPKLRPATVKEAISDLYEMEPDTEGGFIDYAGPSQSEYQEQLRCYDEGPDGGVYNHALMGLPDHYQHIPQGERWTAIPDDLLTEKELERKLRGQLYNASELHRVRENRYASTVTGMQNKMHPIQNRKLSVREACRLMGFPDWWRWPSSWDYSQMAAGVCPPVLKWYAQVISHKLGGDAVEPPVGHLF